MDARLSRRRTPSLRGREFLPALLMCIALGVCFAPRFAAAQGAGTDTLTLVWTAPGDDGQVGTAARFEVRLSTSPISASNWDSAWLVGGAPAPLPAGTRQRLVVRGLTQGTVYYFAIRSVDDADNMSAISNVVRWDWILDTAPPAAPTGVSAAVENTSVRVRWSANSEADLAGYTVYRKLTSSGAYQPVSSPGLSATQFVDATIPAGTTQVWYQITASDVNGNESARSATSTASFGGASAASTFELQPAYPNPSRGPAAINIPLSVPSAGSGAELLVMDSGGRRVRRLAVGMVSGPQVVVWDGRNESGSWVAPGIYTAWLIGAGERRSIKLVRQP